MLFGSRIQVFLHQLTNKRINQIIAPCYLTSYAFIATPGNHASNSVSIGFLSFPKARKLSRFFNGFSSITDHEQIMKEYFLKLYQYNVWANKKVLECLTRQKVTDEKILTLMSHVLAAQFIWLNRIKGLPPSPYKLWHQYSLEELTKMAGEVGQNWLEFVRNNDDFGRELTYNNYVGDPYVNKVENIMIHLVNHSTYHRAQVALLLRQNGYEPVNTDFITYDRVITNQLSD